MSTPTLLSCYFCFCRVQLGDHDLGPLLDGLRTPTDYVLAGEKSILCFGQLHVHVMKQCFMDVYYLYYQLRPMVSQIVRGWSVVQYRSKVSYHLSSRFSQDESRFSWDVSRFSRDTSRFSWESLKHLVWHILRFRNRTCVTIAALQFAKSMGPSNIRCAYM